MDRPGETLHIAVTSGPWQKADNWPIYFFLGRRLQNRIFYVRVTPGDELIDFGPRGIRERKAHFQTWLARLRENNITHVMNFQPASIEMVWMELRPDLFERVTGEPGFWGLYHFRG